jgi:hypothetical protein
MRTASFFAYRNGPGRISIARYAPRDYPRGFVSYPALAPGSWFNKVNEAEYRRRYPAILAALDPAATWQAIHQLARGGEPILLCWESAHSCRVGKTFCHRHIVAEWFAATLGTDVVEVDEA